MVDHSGIGTLYNTEARGDAIMSNKVPIIADFRLMQASCDIVNIHAYIRIH